MLLYVDDCLCVMEHPEKGIESLAKYFPMKPGSIGPPKIYLGAKIGKIQLPNGVIAYSMSMSQYVQEAVKNVEQYLKKRDLALVKKASTPMTANYSPELDSSEVLGSDDATYYQSLIGVLQ